MKLHPLHSTPVFVLGLLLTAGLGAYASDGSSASRHPPPLASAEATTAAARGVILENHDLGPKYILATGDKVRLSWNVGSGGASTGILAKIDSSGSVELLRIGRVKLPGVKIAGLTVAEAQTAIEQTLDNYAGGPHKVTLTIYALAATPPPGFFKVDVRGEVSNSGTYLLPTDTPTTVLDLVTTAGPNEYSVLRRVTLTHTDSDGKAHGVVIDLISKSGRNFTDSNANLALQANDEIYVDQCFCWF